MSWKIPLKFQTVSYIKKCNSNRHKCWIQADRFLVKGPVPVFYLNLPRQKSNKTFVGFLDNEANQEVQLEAWGREIPIMHDDNRQHCHNFILFILNSLFLPAFVQCVLMAPHMHLRSSVHRNALAGRSLRFLLAVQQKVNCLCSGGCGHSLDVQRASGQPVAHRDGLLQTSPSCQLTPFPGSPNPKGHQSQSLQTHKEEKLEKLFRFIPSGQTWAAKQPL